MVLLLCVSVASAQKGKVTGANNYLTSGELDKAKAAIDVAIKHPKCVAWSKAYLTQGKIYQAIFESSVPAYKKLADKPLEVAYEAYLKCMELDEDNKHEKAIKAQMTNLIPDFTNKAILLYNSENYADALKSFERVLEIENSEMFKNDNLAVDTAVIYNAGLAAQKANNLEAAAKYYKLSIEHEYGKEKPYAYLYKILKDTGKEEEALVYLHKGFESYPSEPYMLVELINHYLLGPNPNEAITYLDKAIALDPENASYHRAKGTAYEKINDPQKAKEAYEMAVAKDPNDYVSQYNLGVMRLNVAEEARKVANEIMDQKKYEAALKKLYELYKETIPFFEKVIEIQPTEHNSISILKELYFKIRNEKPEYMENYEKYNALLNKVKSENSGQ